MNKTLLLASNLIVLVVLSLHTSKEAPRVFSNAPCLQSRLFLIVFFFQQSNFTPNLLVFQTFVYILRDIFVVDFIIIIIGNIIEGEQECWFEEGGCIESRKLESGSWKDCCQSGVNPATLVYGNKPGSKLELID